MNDNLSANDKVEAATSYNTQPNDSMAIEGYYTAICYSADGFVKWTEDIHNVVCTVGKNATLDSILGNSSQGAVVMGLKGTGTAVAADTMTNHSTWVEVGGTNAPQYTGNRPSPSFSVATAGSKTTSAAVTFTMSGTSGTVAGCFINIGGSATKDTTSGILFSAGDFSSSKSVVSGDTIAVTYTATLT
jgi:hypothetical protein